MQIRRIATQQVSSIGLGCMNLSHAYGVPPSKAQAEKVLLGALDAGITLLDTAALYGFGANEELLGQVLRGHRHRFTLASKCGIFQENGRRVIDGRPVTIKKTCEDSLRRLQTEVIDLYYLHRWDKNVPIEDSVGALSDLVAEGKIRSIGLSEVSAVTLRKAHAIHPVAALQTEYSLWTRNPEIAVLDACRELDVAFVAFSPLGRGFLSTTLPDITQFEEKDIRRSMPRFSADNMAANLALHWQLSEIALVAECTIPQLALAWLLRKGDHVIALPGTTNLAHLNENIAAARCELSKEVMSALDQLMDTHPVHGTRYNASTQAEIDTEEFA